MRVQRDFPFSHLLFSAVCGFAQRGGEDDSRIIEAAVLFLYYGSLSTFS